MRLSPFSRTPHPTGPRMGARSSGGPRAQAGFLLLLLLGLLAPGVQGARGRGGTEKNSYRRTVNTFSQSVSSLFGEDNVRAAQKVGAAPAPAVTLPQPSRTRGPPGPCAASGAAGRPGRGKRGARVWGGGARAEPRSLPLAAQALPSQRRVWGPVPAQGLGAPSVPRGTSPWTLPPGVRGPGLLWAALTPAAPLIHSFNTFE